MGYQKLTPIIATGTSAPRYLDDRFADVLNLKDFGAKGNGVTDDSAAWTAWETALQSGAFGFVPKGSYLVDNVVKTFNSGRLIISGYNPSYAVKNTVVERGETPSNDSDVIAFSIEDLAGNRLGCLRNEFKTDKTNSLQLLVYKGTDSSFDHATLGIVAASDGTFYTVCPHPAANSNSESIATTQWCVTTKKFASLAGEATSNTSWRFNKTSGSFDVFSGSGWNSGSGIILFGYNAGSGDAGTFSIRASSKSSDSSTSGSLRILRGTPDGNIYWNGSAIQTSSDERLKQNFSNVSNDILDKWGDIKWVQFKYIDAVKEKGENSRFHTGLIAQHVKSEFEKSGLDICSYGILCHEQRKAVEERRTVVDADAYTDADGVYHEKRTHEEVMRSPAVDEWTVRYTEALCMEAAYQRRRADRLEARLAELEERVNQLTNNQDS